jgi:hypothetical protein
MQRKAFIDKFGREPDQNDPLIFDPDKDVPAPLDPDRLDADLEKSTEGFRRRPCAS